MAVYRITRSLTAGEVSPLMYGRTDLDAYKKGCKSVLNAYIKPQGPLIRRPGTQFIEDMSTLFGETIESYKLVDFVFDEYQSYCLVFLTGPTKTEIYFASYNSTYEVFGLVADPITPTTPYKVVNITATGFNLVAGEFDYAQSKDVLFIVSSDEVPLQLSRINHNEWALSSVTFTGTPTKWTALNGYPKRVSFYEQRLVFASTKAYPQHIWFSESGNYFNMTPGTSGSDPFELQIKSEKHNQIQWLASGSRLFVGSIGDEWTVSGGTDYFSIDNVKVEKHSAKGGESIKPIGVGNTILYVGRLGRAINEFTYDYTTAGYSSVDLSVVSSHLTSEYSIVRWAHQAVPNSLVWCIRSDDSLISLTFQREHEVAGWTVHETEGLFKDVCCIPEETNRETNTWFLIERDCGGSSLLYLERLTTEFMDQDAETAWFVDAGIGYNQPGVAITSLSGLDHLEGKEVSILTNGAVHPNRVVNGGSINLIYEADKVIVGLTFITRIIPLSAEVQLDNGTSVGRVQRITNVNIGLYRSLGMWLGRNEEEMEEIPFRIPTDLTGRGVPLFSGFKRIAYPEGYDTESSVVIEQRQPLPLLITAIVDELEVYT